MVHFLSPHTERLWHSSRSVSFLCIFWSCSSYSKSFAYAICIPRVFGGILGVALYKILSIFQNSE